MTAEPHIPAPWRPSEPDGDQRCTVERIDTVPMSTDDYDNAVQALAALISAWRRAAPGDTAQRGSAPRGVE